MIEDSLAIFGCTTSVYPIPQGIYVTTDKGANWFLPETVEDPTKATDFIKFNDEIYFCSNRGISKSTDNGLTWSYFNSGITSNISYHKNKLLNIRDELYFFSSSHHEIYKLVDTLWTKLEVSPEPNYISTDGEDLFFVSAQNTYKLNLTDLSVTNFTNGLNATTLTPYAIDDNNVLAVGYGKLYKTENSGDNWNQIANVEIKRLLVEESKIFAVGPSGITVSNDASNTWAASDLGIPGSYKEYSTSIVSSNNKIFTGFSKSRSRVHLPAVWEAGGVFSSTNNGSTWQQTSNGLPSEGGVRVPVYFLYSSDAQVIAKTNKGLFRTTNGGQAWNFFEEGLPEFSYELKFKGFNSRIYCINNKGIFYATPESDTWQDANTGLPIQTDPLFYFGMELLVFKNKLYLIKTGSAQFIYVLENDKWFEMESDLPIDIEFTNLSSAENIIYASALDAGIWRGSIGEITGININEQLVNAFELLQNYPNPFNPETNFVVNLSEAATVDLKIFDITGRLVFQNKYNNMKAGENTIKFNGTSLASGTYLAKVNALGKTRIRKILLLK